MWEEEEDWPKMQIYMYRKMWQENIQYEGEAQINFYDWWKLWEQKYRKREVNDKFCINRNCVQQ